TIDFNISGSGVQTISLLSALPSLTVPTTIDGTSQPGYAGAPLIDLDGTGAGSGASGLVLGAGSGGSTILGLAINNFSSEGIDVSASGGNTGAASYLGTNAPGTAPGSNPKAQRVLV